MPLINPLPDTLNNLIKAHFKDRKLTEIQVSPLTPDGSDRNYYRISSLGYDPIIAVDAKGTGLDKSQPSEISQNQTFILIRDHLDKLDFPVPQIFSTAHNHNYYLLEDLGDNSVYHTIKKLGWNQETIELYQNILELLLKLQSRAKDRFDPSWCYAGGYYDRQLIHEHELNYFLNAFVVNYCKIKIDHKRTNQLQSEFNSILEATTGAPSDFFSLPRFSIEKSHAKRAKSLPHRFSGCSPGSLLLRSCSPDKRPLY